MHILGNGPFALLLTDNFLIFVCNGSTSDFISGYEKTVKTQLSVMKVDGPDISKYVIIVQNEETALVIGLIETLDFKNVPSN
jgi:UTP--glucose-1-phosphate uridylyltransferase